LNIFYKSKEVFQLKEIEKLGAKAGVVINTVKDVVQSLLDDNLVETDKIGIGNFLWALPSKGAQSRANKLASLEETAQHLLTERKMLRTQLEEAEETKEEESGRTELVERYEQLKEQVTLQAAALEVLHRNDPRFLEERLKEAEGACRIANVWTENIWLAKQFLVNKGSGLSSSEIDKHFGIPADLDSLG
jgi:DNA-binding transcriptional regulator YhcF (GntR family)